MIPHPLCLLRWIARSAWHGAWIEGHDYIEIDEPTPPNVHVVRCAVCGELNVGWDWAGVEKHPGHHWRLVRLEREDAP